MSKPNSSMTTLLNKVKAKSKQHHQEVMGKIFTNLISTLILELKKAQELKKPIFILSGESHSGLKEFVAKILLSSAASFLGIKHHCLESDNRAALDVNSKFEKSIFLRHLATLGVYVTEVDKAKNFSCSEENGSNLAQNPEDELYLNKARTPLEKESIITRFNAHFRNRNQMMADLASMPAVPGILYVGMGHFREIFEFLEDRFHVVIIDVAHISADQLHQYNESFQEETGLTMREIEFSYDFILESLATGALRKVYIPIIETNDVVLVAGEKIVFAPDGSSEPSSECKKAYRYYQKVLRDVLIENDVFLSVRPTIKEEFLALRLNRPLLHQFSLARQREDQGWIQEMNTKVQYRIKI